MSFSFTKNDLIGYHVTRSSSATEALTQHYGDCLERMTSGDKLALLATLAGFLADDSDEYDLHAASQDCGLRASDEFYVALAMLEGIQPRDALDLQVAIANQLKSGVYAA